MPITLFLIMSSLLFVLGVFVVCTRRNAIGFLMGIELILNAASLNFIVFAHFGGNKVDGQIVTLFIIALAACESVIALAIVLGLYRRFRSIETTNVESMKN